MVKYTLVPPPQSVAIIGAGPAGLTAAYLLAKKGVTVTVFEADPQYVGGISRTVVHGEYRFDIGGHRFFSKSQQVEDFWTEILQNDLLVRPRSSQIYYRNKFFSYPLRAWEALIRLGLWESAHCLLSYAKAQIFPKRDARSFADWVTNQFGHRLFSIFFKTYTEKVWGMSCSDISADWAAQRIQGLSLGKAIWNALFGGRAQGVTGSRKEIIKTLIGSFRYPRKGPGMMWETCAARVRSMGGTIIMGAKAEHLRYDANVGTWLMTARLGDGTTQELRAHHIISSAPIAELIPALTPEASPKAIEAATALRYRDFLTVALIVEGEEAFQDNWIYIHDPSVKVGRIQNFRSWSPEMVPTLGRHCYGLEYFCFEGDELWSSTDQVLGQLAQKEFAILGLTPGARVVETVVVRQRKAYPVYDDRYEQNVLTVRRELDERYPGLHLVGRNGMHKYNNQDHAMMTAMLTVENILAGKRLHDVWQVNQDAEYHEADKSVELREVPQALTDRRKAS